MSELLLQPCQSTTCLPLPSLFPVYFLRYEFRRSPLAAAARAAARGAPPTVEEVEAMKKERQFQIEVDWIKALPGVKGVTKEMGEGVREGWEMKKEESSGALWL